MKKIFLYSMFLCTLLGYGQSSFKMDHDIESVTIPFKLIGNSIVLPLQLNGTELNFILDSGASKSILFDYQNIDSLQVQVGKKVRFTGYGLGNDIDGFASKSNKAVLHPKLVHPSWDILVLIDNPINLSAIVGYPVNGLLGIDFFKDYLVKIDFQNQHIQLFKHTDKNLRKFKKYQTLPMPLIDNQLHIPIALKNHEHVKAKLAFIDTGNNDALWLNSNDANVFTANKISFEDYLGHGIKGDVLGKRTKVDQILIGSSRLMSVTTSVPYKESLIQKDADFVSVGNEVLKRFVIVFDLKNARFYFKTTREIKDGFYYNMAGIVLKNSGFEIERFFVQNPVQPTETRSIQIVSQRPTGYQKINIVPKIFIHRIVPGSIADHAGLKEGDQIVKFNGTRKTKLNLFEITNYFYTKPNSKVKLTIKRDSVEIKKELLLVPLIP